MSWQQFDSVSERKEQSACDVSIETRRRSVGAFARLLLYSQRMRCTPVTPQVKIMFIEILPLVYTDDLESHLKLRQHC